MKKRSVIPVMILAIALVGGFGFSAMAVSDDFGPGWGPGWGRCNEDGRGPGMRGFGRMAAVLDLTDEQEEQVEAIIEAERSSLQPLRDQMREARNELHAIVRSGSFDEAAVREVAARMSQTRTEMIVAKTRVKSKIYAVLTPEQQELADKVEPMFEQKRGRHHRPF